MRLLSSAKYETINNFFRILTIDVDTARDQKVWQTSRPRRKLLKARQHVKY